jgi:hypothetical protein
MYANALPKMDTTLELLRIEVRRLLDAAEMTSDRGARGKLLAEALRSSRR